MPRVGKKSASTKQQTASGVPVDPWVEGVGQPRSSPTNVDAQSTAEPRTPTQSPTRPHIGVVEQDIADILLDVWQARTDGGDSSQSTHAAAAKQLIDSADQQDLGLLEKAFVSVQDDYDEHTLGDVADRILIYTVQKGWGAACQLCVKYHADINAQDEDNGGTPLMYAIHNAHDAIVETLLQLGADMEHEEQQGYTPLMVACLSDNATACEMLLKNKAALDNTDSKGRTALSMACRYGSLECVKVLTTCGANVSHRDEDGMSVLEHAEQNDRRQVVGLIKRAQLANQMRQRRKQKNQHKENGMTMEEFLHREEKAKETMVELLQEIEKESECAESRKARQRAKRNAKKNEKKVAKRKDLGVLDEPNLGSKHEKSLDTCKSSGTDNIQRCSSSAAAAGSDLGVHPGAGGEEKDRFGCTMQEAAELDAFRRVLLEGRVSPEEAVWQWCSDEDDIKPEQLRKMWDFMVDAASQCRLPEKQGTFLNIVTVLIDVCQNHGISVKQGKKVKQRLEKVDSLRRGLQDAMRPPVDESRLEAAMDSVRPVASLLEDELIASARVIIEKLQAGGEEAAALRCATPASDEETTAQVSLNAQGESVGGSTLLGGDAPSMQDQHGSTGVPATPSSSRSVLEAAPHHLQPTTAEVQHPPQHPSWHAAQSMHADHAVPPTTSAARPQMQMTAGMPSRSASSTLCQPPPPAGALRDMHAHGANGTAAQVPSMHPNSQQRMRELAPKPHVQPTPPSHPPAPAPPGGPPPPNPFSGTQSAVDPMDLLGQDLVGALDSGGNLSATTRTPAGQSGWKAMNGTAQASPVPPRQAPMHAHMRVQPPATGMRPYGGVFRSTATGPTGSSGTSRPPPGPPPAPPPLTSMVDAYGGPKPPAMQRNGMKMHPSPTQQSGYSSYGPMRTFDPKMDPQAGSTHTNGFVMPQQMHGDVLTRKDSAPRFSSLNMRAAPFLPASKNSGGVQGPSQHSNAGKDMHTQPFLKSQPRNGVNTFGMPSRDDSHVPSHALPSDPFGLDSAIAGHAGGEMHRLRRNATVNAVNSVLGGGAGGSKGSSSEPTLAAYNAPSPAARGVGAQSHGIEETLLGLDFLDVLDGGNS